MKLSDLDEIKDQGVLAGKLAMLEDWSNILADMILRQRALEKAFALTVACAPPENDEDEQVLKFLDGGPLGRFR